MNIFSIKVKGFTVLEMIFAMLLSSLVVMFIFSAQNHVNKVFGLMKSTDKFINQFITLSNILRQKTHNAKYIIGNNEIFNIQSIDENIEILINKNKLILKNNNRCDTFHFKEITSEVKYLNLYNKSIKNKIITNISLKINHQKENLFIYIKKEYDSATLINNFNHTN
jgi:hypothetical protein